MIIRKLKSSRLKGVHTHSCPIIEERRERCDESCEHFQSIKNNTSSYEVTCVYKTDTALPQFKPSKAYAESTMADYMGSDPLAVVSNPWLQPKYDGARVLLHITTDGVRVTSRRVDRYGLYSELTGNFHGLFGYIPAETLAKFNGTVLDGELIYPVQGDATGTLGSTMQFMGSSPDKAWDIIEKFGPPNLYMFDMPFLKGNDIRKQAYSLRWTSLMNIMEIFSSYVDKMSYVTTYHTEKWTVEKRRDLLQRYLDNKHEGLVCKNPKMGYDDRYFMLKAKESVTTDVQVIDYELGAEGSKYADQIGAFVVGVIDEATMQLREIGKVPPGDDATRKKYSDLLIGNEHIIDEDIIIELKAQNFTKEYKLRHAAIVKYRPDRSTPNVVDFTKVRRK